MKNKLWLALGLVCVFSLVGVSIASAATMSQKLKGKILLQVEEKGEAWYVYPVNLKKYYLGRPADAFKIMKELGLGVTHEYVLKYKENVFPSAVWGKILIDVGDVGKAYYIYPADGTGYYLGKPNDAFNVMRQFGLGITNTDLAKIIAGTSTTVVTPTTVAENLLKSTYTCGVCNPDEKCVNGKCTDVVVANKSFCGNFVCEAGESYDGSVEVDVFKQCSLDCSASCTGDNCNDYVRVDCGCAESAKLSKRHGCVADAPACSSCGGQTALFPELLKIQTDVVQCLQEYFSYKPPRLVYKVFHNPTLEKCDIKSGCEGTEGGASGSDYVMFHNINGARSYGSATPTAAGQITADVHETAHYFLYQMVHGAPGWFHEAVAIQTNERVNCTDRQMTRGDSYLKEKDTDAGGINLSGNNFLNYDFYRKYKKGSVSLTATEKNNHYLTASLFIMGLKDDFACGKDCWRDIVIKLHEYELEKCANGIDKCGVSNYQGTWGLTWLGGLDGAEKGANAIIKNVVEEVVGKSVTTLYTLLGIKY